MAAAALARYLRAAFPKAADFQGSGWFGPHMAAASCAIAERVPLVDLVLEIRDARIPLSSAYEQLRYVSSRRRIIVLNKTDLANCMEVKDWVKFFEHQNCISCMVNSHNKESIKEFLKFIRAQVTELKKTDRFGYAATVMLVGIPNVGKSALANALHRIGRISAEEKGRLKHVAVSPLPGETKNISSLKIGSHPSVYVLDTPGVLPPEIPNVKVCYKLALTGAIRDCTIGEKELAYSFLAILNSNDEYKKWAKFSTILNNNLSVGKKAGNPESDIKLRGQYPSDHTQDIVVQGIRHTLYESISSFNGNVGDEADLRRLIEVQFVALQEAFHLPVESGENINSQMATKLLNLYRTGRLGRYILDNIPRTAEYLFP